MVGHMDQRQREQQLMQNAHQEPQELQMKRAEQLQRRDVLEEPLLPVVQDMEIQAPIAHAAPAAVHHEGRSERKKREQMEHALARANELNEEAHRLDVGSAQRSRLLKEKEKLNVKAHKLKKELAVDAIENEQERSREKSTLRRHALYETMQSVFRKENPLSHEDAEWTHPVNGHRLVNAGRAFFGGTKPMYIFEDRDAPIMRDGQIVGYKQYLFKEAINCVGFDKPQGALVTEAAARLQQELCGEYSIPAFAAELNGRVLGSFQEKIEMIEPQQRVDLFAWQAQPQDNIPAEMKNEILREHALDWLLCNFDTKGENFLHRTDGHLCSFDKEASFSKLSEEGAQQMSTTYKPHANDTLYNTLFTEFAEGRMTLELNAVTAQITHMEQMDNDAYLDLFDRMLTNKYGEKSTDRVPNPARDGIEQKILERKTGLREAYRNFFEGLIARRQAAGMNDCNNLLNAQGRFVFRDES